MSNLIKAPSNAVEIYPDSHRFKCGYAVKSASSNKLYKISFDAAPGAGYFVCSCAGACIHGDCKHLRAAGLRGRKYGRDEKTIKILGLKI